jgi:hypothetical protein
MKRTPVADIYFNGEDFQSVPFEYRFIKIDGIIRVNYLKLKLFLFGKPTDLDQDLSVAIAEDLGLRNESLVRIDCEVQLIKYEVSFENKAA